LLGIFSISSIAFMKKVLILGAGMVAKPMVEYLLKNDINILIASPMKERADLMIGGNPLGKSIDWSMDEPDLLDKLVAEHDITVSLLPYSYHTSVAKVCLKYGKHLVTTSYVQKDMMSLDEAAREKGLLFLNETGLDPGIDHMSAMRIIDHIHGKGGRVDEFYSLCGALPAPEAANNPLGYKFSWSPKGVILASRNGAFYLKKGKNIIVEPSRLFRDRFTYEYPGIGNLEAYPNRDSTSYIEIYRIPETRTMYRGTFRFPGWCETLDAMKSLNMLDDTFINYEGMTFSAFLAERGKVELNDIRKNIAAKLGVKENSAVIKSFDFLGFFSNEPLHYTETSPFEITSDRMISRMMLADNERDMVVLQHIFMALYPDGTREVIKSSMLDFGSASTNTSISRTVALPAAIAVKLILEDKISLRGVLRPVYPEIYNPIIEELKTLGIEMKEEFGLPVSEMIK
jgi:saccharopine dehydrogenase-like NADP-dependent oxidoreductase